MTPRKHRHQQPASSSDAPAELHIRARPDDRAARGRGRHVGAQHPQPPLPRPAPAPEVRARVGYYGADHVARLRLILDLQADGFNLTAIERLLSGSDGLAERLLGLRHAVTTPFEAETPEVVTAEDLAKSFGEVSSKDIERVRKLRLLVPLGGDRFEVPSPALLRAAEEVVALGISLHAALALMERVSRNCESISRAFAKLFLKELWDPFEQAGQPDERGTR